MTAARRTSLTPHALAAVLGLAFVVSGCAMRLSGFVTDSVTGEPVDNAAVTVGKSSAHVDSAGHYSIKARFNTREKLVFAADGYETRRVGVKAREERFRELDVQLVPQTGKEPAR